MQNELRFTKEFKYVIESTIYKSEINKTAFYKAKDTETGKRVGIKVIKCNPNQLKNYITEIRILMKLEDFAKNVPTVYQYYTHNNTLFIVMQYIEGRTLFEIMEAEKESILTSETTCKNLERLKKLANVLANVHHNDIERESHIQHKDLKPQNIIIKGYGKNEDLYLIDFGLSANIAVRGSGTIGYQAPEQSKMFSDIYDTSKIDVFAFGLIMYELLCGKKLIFGEDLILDNQKSEWINIPKISDTNKNIDKAIDEIFENCILYNPAKRINDGGKIAWQLKKAITKKR